MQEGKDFARADELLLSKHERSEDEATLKGQEHLAPAGWQRYLVTFFLFSGLANVYALRANLSVAVEPMQQIYGWSNATQGWVLSSFFW